VDELRRLAGLDHGWDWAKTAIIAREWRALDPVRSYCELRGIPVQMADEESVHCWHLRETRDLIDWLRGTEGGLIGANDIRDWLAAQRDGPWWSLLRDAVDQYGLETAQSTLPREHFIDWLSEWGREVRRRQRGLLLLTAHRAKGLEFDHVAILDGGWNRAGTNEDPDAPRRLFYVAMTRARHTLALAALGPGHPFIAVLKGATCALRRDLPVPGIIPSVLARRYLRLTLKDVDLDFTGRLPATHPVHGTVARLAAGAPIAVRPSDGRWHLYDVDGRLIGRLARAFEPPRGMHCVAGHIHAVIVRRKQDSEPGFQERLCCDQWEVVLPELVYEPGA
jgi:ATP-dependent DNA helicase RecQ